VNCDVNSGYTVPMLVEDSRILEASIFSILHKSHLTTVVGRLLHDIILMTIADEVDSQLKQTMLSYTDRGGQDRRSPINSEPTGPRNLKISSLDPPAGAPYSPEGR
jgi:hypothetical protein